MLHLRSSSTGRPLETSWDSLTQPVDPSSVHLTKRVTTISTLALLFVFVRRVSLPPLLTPSKKEAGKYNGEGRLF